MKKSIEKIFLLVKTNKVVLLPVLLSTLFLYLMLDRAYYNAFIEADFLHFPFLIEFIEQKKLDSFFTIFGEHLVPGYNLFLIVNYYLFDLNVRFEFWIYFVSVLLTAIIISLKGYKDRLIQCKLLAVISFLFLLWPTHAQMWGMALASVLGVFLWVLIFMRIIDGKYNYVTYILILINTLLFDGAYSAGGLTAIFLYSVFLYKYNVRKAVTLALASIFSGIAYIIILSKIGGLHPLASSVGGFFDSIKFICILSSSPLIGNPLFDSIGCSWIYQIAGVLVLGCTSIIFINKLRKANFSFFELLFLYSLANIFFITYARARYGAEHALGDWYITHTQFIILYFIVNLKYLFKSHCYLVVVVSLYLGISAIVGFHFIWKKSFYVKAWKKHFVDQSSLIINDETYLRSAKSDTDTMIWNGHEVKTSLLFMKRHKKWIFTNEVNDKKIQ